MWTAGRGAPGQRHGRAKPGGQGWLAPRPCWRSGFLFRPGLHLNSAVGLPPQASTLARVAFERATTLDGSGAYPSLAA